MQTTNTQQVQAKSSSFLARHGNQITIAFWIIALASHAFLIPKFIKDVFQKQPKSM